MPKQRCGCSSVPRMCAILSTSEMPTLRGWRRTDGQSRPKSIAPGVFRRRFTEPPQSFDSPKHTCLSAHRDMVGAPTGAVSRGRSKRGISAGPDKLRSTESSKVDLLQWLRALPFKPSSGSEYANGHPRGTEAACRSRTSHDYGRVAGAGGRGEGVSRDIRLLVHPAPRCVVVIEGPLWHAQRARDGRVPIPRFQYGPTRAASRACCKPLRSEMSVPTVRRRR